MRPRTAKKSKAKATPGLHFPMSEVLKMHRPIYIWHVEPKHVLMGGKDTVGGGREE